MSEERFFHIGGSLRDPYRENERLTSPFLPGLAEIVGERIALPMVGASTSAASPITSRASRIACVVLQPVLDLGIARNKSRTGVPYVLEQQL